MILISHRGNLSKKNEETENSIASIDKAMSLGLEVEIDVWYVNNKFYLGHDKPEHYIDINYLNNSKLWCHAKNIEALLEFKSYGTDIHYFWHQNDLATITSKGFLWVYPGNQPMHNSISVLPELYGEEVTGCLGICSDYISHYVK
jgi:hypothetical protein